MGTRPGLAAPMDVGERVSLPLAALHPNPANRDLAKDDEIKNLARTIKAVGLLYPLIVRPIEDKPDEYRIIAGERRYRALRRLRAETAPCLVVNGETGPEEAETLGLVENMARRNLTPLEEAAAVRTLIEEGLEPEAVARSLGRSREWVARRSSLTDLSESWVAELGNPGSKIASWPPSHLELVSRFPADVQDRMLRDYRRHWDYHLPTLRDLQIVTGNFLHLIAAAPWREEDDTLVPEAGACATCLKRASRCPDLFAEELAESGSRKDPSDQCLDANCWKLKSAAFITRRIEEVRRDHENVICLNTDDSYHDQEEEGPIRHAVRVSDVAVCRKRDPGARPALIINGPGLGRIKWVRLSDDDEPDQYQADRPEGNGDQNGHHPDPTDQPAERTPEQKKEPYDKRRRQVVIDAVRRKLDALAATESMDEAAVLEGGAALINRTTIPRTLYLLHQLLSEWGWRKDAHVSVAEVPEPLTWDILSRLIEAPVGWEPVRAVIFEISWSLMRLCLHTLSHRLMVATGERTNDRQYAEAERVCSMLGFDLAVLRAEAAEAIPYAKLWRDLVEDDWKAAEASVPEPVNGTARGPKNGTGETGNGSAPAQPAASAP